MIVWLTLLAAALLQSQATFRTEARLIVEAVTVKDKSGKAIEGLTADDFTLVEDGVAQTISFVEFQRLDGAPPPPTVAVAAAPVVPAGIRHRDTRLLVLYFDLAALAPPDLLRAGDAARAFIVRHMAAADRVAIMTFKGGAVRMTCDFTADREALGAAVQDVLLGGDKDGDGLPDWEGGTAFGQDDGEFAIFNTDRQLSAVQTAVSMLRPFAEQKSLIYLSSGLRLNGTDNQAQLRATINAAIRANVAIHTIDARGLVALAPLGDATRPSPGGIGMFTGQLANAALTAFQRSQDALYALAKDTGGQPLFDTNDLTAGIVRAAASMGSYYLIGYYSTHTAADGRFRRVKVAVNRPGAELTYRQGYFGDKTFAAFTAADKERQLEDALLLENPITDLPMAIEVNYFQVNRAQYFVPVAVRIPGGAVRTRVDFIGEVKDAYGATIQNLRDRLDVPPTDRSIQIEIGFTVLPGPYTIKLLARDADTGRIGTYQTSFVVPNLEKEATRVPTSSVVLASQRVRPADAVYSVKEKVASSAVNPLVHDGLKLMPSVTRVFSRRRPLYVFLQAYERDAVAMRPLVAFVTFFRADAKVFETPAAAVATGLDPRTKAVPIRFDVALDALSPGAYECQVAVLDPQGAKVAFWRTPVLVVP